MEGALNPMRNALRKLFQAALILGLLTGTALAQFPMPGISLGHDEKRKLTPEEQARQDKLDEAYKAATKKIPEQKASDPWADVRSAPSGPPSAGSGPGQKSALAQKKKPPPQQQ